MTRPSSTPLTSKRCLTTERPLTVNRSHTMARPLTTALVFTLLASCSGGEEETPGDGDGAGGTTMSTGGLSGSGGGSSSGGGVSTGGNSGGNSSGGQAGAGGGNGSGGAVASGGDGAGGGDGSGGAETGGADGAGGDPGTGGASAACEVIGFATRQGRTSTPFDVTGGGNTTPIIVTSFSELEQYAADGEPRVLHLDGTLGAGWSGRDGDRLEIKSNKTIIGLRAGTELRSAIHINNAQNVILKNVVVNGPGSNSDQAWDNLNIEGNSKNIWVDHCEFWNGQDGNADVVKGADNVTFSWNIFGYTTGGEHNFSNLVASSDDEPESAGKLNITLMFNWFSGVAQRQPRCRYGDIHVVNNLFTRDGQTSDYGISAGFNCRVLTEANHFIEIKSPIYTGHQSGTSANQLIGNNIFENTTGNTTGYGTAFAPPYEYESVLVPSSQVKALVQAGAGATLASPDDCQ